MTNPSKTIWILSQYASTPETGMGGRHYYLAKELAKQGHKVYLIAASYTHLLRSRLLFSENFKVESTEGFQFVWVKMPEYSGAHDKKRIFNWFLFAWKTLKLPKIIPEKPDIILASSPSLLTFLGAKRLAIKFKAKLVFEVRDIWPLTLIEIGGYSTKHPFIRFLQWIEDKAYKDADVVISNLPNAVEHMVERGMNKNKFYWIKNGLDIEEVSNSQPLSESILDSFPKDKFVIGYLGTLGEVNALEYFIESAKIKKNDDSIAWVLVGKGKEKENLKKKVKNLKLSNVFFVDAVAKNQVQSILKLFDICYIGWRNKSIYRFGIAAQKIPEYMFSRKPVIQSFSGYSDVIQKSNSGFTVPAEDPIEVVKALEALINMGKEKRELLGKNGYEYVLECYDYSNLAKKLSEILSQ
jgi:glycosyltransferase involved in cell wall biosynthesis